MSARDVLAGAALAVAASLALAACAPAPSAIPSMDDETRTPSILQTPSASPDSLKDPMPTVSESSASPSPAAGTPSASPTPTTLPALYAPGDTGEGIRELQHRLLQLQWLAGEITESYGPQTQAAVEGFQAKRGISVTGEVDEKTWKTLVAMTRKPTHDEMYNVMKPGPAIYKQGQQGKEIRDLQSRMRQIGWFGPTVDGVYGPATVEGIRGFQEKRGFPVTGEVDQRTLDRLHAMTHKPTAEELENKLPKKDSAKAGSMQLDPRCLSGRAICISKRQRQLAWVVDGKIQMTMDVRFGAKRSPTREGAFRVEWKSRNHVSKLYNSKMPYALFFSGGQAVHYSSDFAARGYRGASHGCVNVRDKNAVAPLFNQAKVGDKVIVY